MHELARFDPAVEVVWRAFELRPEPVATLDPRGEYLQRVWENSVYLMAERLGKTMKLPPVQPRSRLAHEAAHWAREQGRFDDYHAAVFSCFFERGEDIGRVEVLTSLAAELRLNSESLRDALGSRQFEMSVLDDEREAEALAIRGVPAFLANQKAALPAYNLSTI